MAPATVEFRLTPEVAARAVEEFFAARRADLARNVRGPFRSLVLYAACCGAVAVVAHRLEADAAFALAATVLAAIAGGFVVLMAGLHAVVLVALRVGAGRARRTLVGGYAAAPDPLVTWTFTADGFETRLGERVRSTTWAAVRKLHATPGFWVFEIAGGPHLFLPRAAVPLAVADAIRGWAARPL